MKRNAVALRSFTHANAPFRKGKVILDMSPGQFADWKSAGLLGEATAAEVTAARPKAEPKTDLPAGQSTPRDAG